MLTEEVSIKQLQWREGRFDGLGARTQENRLCRLFGAGAQPVHPIRDTWQRYARFALPRPSERDVDLARYGKRGL